MTIAYLSLGSNIGDRLGYLAGAVRRLQADDLQVTAISSVYETAPQGKTDQPPFLNIAVQVETSLSATALLARIQAVEQALGRVRHERWGPRTLDIDIVLFGDEIRETEELTLPHPRMMERAFVLVPLIEINPDVRAPAVERPLAQVLRELPDQQVVLHTPALAFQKLVFGTL